MEETIQAREQTESKMLCKEVGFSTAHFHAYFFQTFKEQRKVGKEKSSRRNLIVIYCILEVCFQFFVIVNSLDIGLVTDDDNHDA